MTSLISICIPTYRRPDLLKLALESCAAQTYPEIEIVIGDDSPDEDSTNVVEAFRRRREWLISYRRNVPALGQNANVSELFSRATGERIVLLHDDDLLLPHALDSLSAPWRELPDLALTFGRQEIIDQAGVLDPAHTRQHNIDFNRTGTSGPKAQSLGVSLLLQIPNNGFMIRADVARDIDYRNYETVGVYCDTDFAIRVGASLGSNQIYYVDELVSQYRMSDESISTAATSRRSAHPRAAVSIYEYVEKLDVEKDFPKETEFFRNHLIDKLVKGYAITRKRRAALKYFFSRTYGWKRRFSGRGLYHLVLILDPRLDRLRPYE